MVSCCRRRFAVFLSFSGIMIFTYSAMRYGSQRRTPQKLPLDFILHGRNETPPTEMPERFVTFAPFSAHQGLANQIFKFVGLFYVAVKTNREVVIFENHNAQTLEKCFDLFVRRINRTCPCFLFREHNISYDARIEKEITREKANSSQTILLDGLFQSWSYLRPVEQLIRTHMKFRHDVETSAREFLRKVIPSGWKEGALTRVGIHNRRGDFVGKDALEFGFTTAPKSYFLRAMKHFVDRFRPIQFIVVSTDSRWSRENIIFDSSSSSSSDVNVTYSPVHSAAVDLAILSFCDHVIASTGTFGWMAGWLANGTTIYYPDYPRNGSYLRGKINPSDYFPPTWIPVR